MIQSMTGFASVSLFDDNVALCWEIRSVNHRFLDLSFILPSNLREIEGRLRAEMNSFIHRGKIDATLTVKSNKDQSLELEESKILELIAVKNKLDNLTQGACASLSFAEIVAWPGVIKEASNEVNIAPDRVMAAFKDALYKLRQMREDEGAKLVGFLLQRFAALEACLIRVAEQLKQDEVLIKNKINAQLHALKADINSEVQAQALGALFQKLDVTEELDRVAIHCFQSRALLASNEAVIGRRLDFIVQELHREVNTLGAKAASIKVTDIVIDMKVLIEQIREQVQNVE